MNRFEVDIDEIVVTGVPVSDVDAFRASLRARLTALAAQGGPVRWDAAELSTLTVPPVPHVPGDAAFGANVADSLWRGLTASGGAP